MEAIALNSPASIRQYFETVCLLHDKGEEFPIDWDLVWPLVYSRKDKAVEYLKQFFIESVDYQVSHQKVENLKGGRPSMTFKISVSCLEFSIARKIKAVFEVYRLVFHKARIETKPISPLDIAEQLLQQARQQEARLSAVEDRVLQIEAKTSTSPDYFTIMGYSVLHNVKISHELAASLGKKASAICNQNGYNIGKTPDKRYGQVGSYPSDVLKQVFESTFTNIQLRP